MDKDTQEEVLLMEEDSDSVPTTPGNSSNFALTDAVKLLSTAISSQFQQLTEKLKAHSQNSAQLLSKKLKDNIAEKLKYEGNKVQYLFNEEILEDIEKLTELTAHNQNVVKGLKDKLKTRQKHIRIADNSPAGWKTVKEYQCSDIADDSDDEKKIRSTENRAISSAKQPKKFRFQPYNKPAPSAAAGSASQLSALALQQANVLQPTDNRYESQPFRAGSRRTPQPSDVCYKCSQTGHWKNRCPLNYQNNTGSSS
jgi:hypothetical protein